MRDSIVFYRSFYEAAKDLPDEEFAKAMRAILAYALDGEELDPEGIAKVIFTMAKPQIDKNNKRYTDGSKGGRPKKSDGSEKETEEKTSGFENEKPVVSKQKKNKKPNVNVNVNDNENDNDNDNVNDNVNDNANENHKGRAAPEIYYPNDEKLNQTFCEYIQMRKSIKKPMTDKAIELAMKKLEELSTSNGAMDDDLAIKILEQSVFRSWQGLFPLDNSGDKKKSVFDEWRNA